MTQLVAVSDLPAALRSDGPWDAVVLISPKPAAIADPALRAAVVAGSAIDAQVDRGGCLLAAPGLAGGRLIVAPTGPLERDQDDVRRFAAAAVAGVRRARDAGARRPLCVVAGRPADPGYGHATSVVGLAALGCLWEPLEAREALGADVVEPVDKIGLASTDRDEISAIVGWCNAVDGGVRLAKDLCGTNPERMAPPRFADLCREAMAGLPVEVQIVADQAEIGRDYPLTAAVARASMPVARHHPRIVRLEYTGAGPITQTLLLAGKGVTYDTGGADIKAGGVMAGMSRDKGGAAAIAGLVHAIAVLRPKGLKVIAELGCVRNSIGADAYVTDEIITSHAGVRVRIGNTDAEGRLVLCDLLSHLRERAKREPAPRLFTVATLTGHAARAVGAYTSSIDNGPARADGVTVALAAAGELWGDPFDPQRLRPEDFDFVKPRSKADDLLSCNNAPSTATTRGHQFPMAFLILAAGLDKHGRDSKQPLPYSHLDIAGSATEGGDWQHGRPTGRPVVGMLAALAESTLPR